MLGNKLHELWEIALEDLKICEADPFYDINMNVWHRINGNQCQICVAGAVIAKRLGTLYSETCLVDFDLDTQRKLNAIDALRRGEVREAYFSLNIDDFEGVDIFEMPKYGQPNWWEKANLLLVYLKEENI